MRTDRQAQQTTGIVRAGILEEKRIQKSEYSIQNAAAPGAAFCIWGLGNARYPKSSWYRSGLGQVKPSLDPA